QAGEVILNLYEKLLIRVSDQSLLEEVFYEAKEDGQALRLSEEAEIIRKAMRGYWETATL
ncbi:MAG: hypothetical protein Q8M56_06930, partial [Desulfobacterales bacterium]|nr:hypothetical protein [Desulfobacterales bacterium]